MPENVTPLWYICFMDDLRSWILGLSDISLIVLGVIAVYALVFFFRLIDRDK